VDLTVSLGNSPRVISGYVLEPDANTPVADVFIGSDSEPNTITDPNGYYELVVEYGWSGTVTPSKIGYIFEPNSGTYINVIEDVNEMDYIASMVQINISGHVTEGLAPLADVNVIAFGGGGDYTVRYGGGSAITDANGFYEVLVDYNWIGFIAPSKWAYSFEPNKLEYNNIIADANNQDYTAELLTYSISGYTLDPNNRPVQDVSVQADNGGSLSITDSNGFYEVWVGYNWSGSVTPSKMNYSFNPNRIDYFNVLEDHADDYLAVHYADINADGFFDENDIAVMSDYWLTIDAPAGNLNDDDIVNFLDFAIFAQFYNIE